MHSMLTFACNAKAFIMQTIFSRGKLFPIQNIVGVWFVWVFVGKMRARCRSLPFFFSLSFSRSPFHLLVLFLDYFFLNIVSYLIQ